MDYYSTLVHNKKIVDPELLNNPKPSKVTDILTIDPKQSGCAGDPSQDRVTADTPQSTSSNSARIAAGEYAGDNAERQANASGYATTALKREHGADVARPFPCLWDDCHKTFTRKSDLARHVQIHRNERPYQCSVCGKAFIQRSALTVHFRTHTGEKPFKCSFAGCSKAFSDSSSLARHRRTHEMVRPFVCPFKSCSKTFSRRALLSRHVRSQHSKEISGNSSGDLCARPSSSSSLNLIDTKVERSNGSEKSGSPARSGLSSEPNPLSLEKLVTPSSDAHSHVALHQKPVVQYAGGQGNWMPQPAGPQLNSPPSAIYQPSHYQPEMPQALPSPYQIASSANGYYTNTSYPVHPGFLPPTSTIQQHPPVIVREQPPRDFYYSNHDRQNHHYAPPQYVSEVPVCYNVQQTSINSYPYYQVPAPQTYPYRTSYQAIQGPGFNEMTSPTSVVAMPVVMHGELSNVHNTLAPRQPPPVGSFPAQNSYVPPQNPSYSEPPHNLSYYRYR